MDDKVADNTQPMLYLVDDTESLAANMGISQERGEALLLAINKILYDNLMHPFNTNRITSRAELMKLVAGLTNNTQELCYAMYKLGYEERVYMERIVVEENRARALLNSDPSRPIDDEDQG